MKHLIVIGGPTASGKTSLAIQVARHFGTEIISGDSRQFYREMRIGNARPEPEELAAVKHHFVADRSLTEPLTAGRFAEEALGVLATIHERNDYAVLVGGSGLYLRALCEGLDEFPDVTDAARTQVQSLFSERGIDGLRAELARLDPTYFATVDQDNPRRLERALLVCYSAGAPYSSFLGNRPERPFTCHYFRRGWPRPELYDRINRRVDLMLAEGLEEEARSLLPYRNLPILQTVGYQEWWPYFDGEYDRARAVELVKRNSRRYAKRQETWFGRGEVYLPVKGPSDLINHLWIDERSEDKKLQFTLHVYNQKTMSPKYDDIDVDSIPSVDFRGKLKTWFPNEWKEQNGKHLTIYGDRFMIYYGTNEAPEPWAQFDVTGLRGYKKILEISAVENWTVFEVGFDYNLVFTGKNST